MKRIKIRNIITGLLMLPLFAAEPVYAQYIPDGGMQSTFNRQLDAVRWLHHTELDWSDEQYFINLNNQFHSRLFLSQGTAQNLQDENDLSLRSGYRLNPQLFGLVEAHSYRFTTTRLSQESLLGGVRYTPLSGLNIEVLGGILSDSRSGESDDGFMGVLRLQSGMRSIGEFQYRPGLRVEWADINPRVQQNYGSDVRFEYLGNDVQLRGELGYGRAVREGYQPSSFFNRDVTDIIESIQSDTINIALRVQFPLTEQIRGSLDIGAQNARRSVENRRMESFDQQGATLYDSEANRDRLEIRGTMEYENDVMSLRFGTDFRYQDRTSQLINTDDIPTTRLVQQTEQLLNSNFEQSRFELFTENNYRFSQVTGLDVRGRAGILRYDTPSVNLDDRDEQSFLLQTTVHHAFSDFFKAVISGTGEATHLVYLSAERSLENNWRRSIRLRPGYEWQLTDRLTVRQDFLVRANYTVQDFVLEGRPVNDQASREFSIAADIEYELADSWKLDVSGSRSELRIGRLFWETFEEIPSDTLISWEGELKISRSTPTYRASIGARYFLKRDFLQRTTIDTEVRRDGMTQIMSMTGSGLQFTHQVGPVVEVMIPFESSNRIYLNGWMQQQLVRRSLYVSYPEEFREEFHKAEQRFQRRFYPNVELMVQFRL